MNAFALPRTLAVLPAWEPVLSRHQFSKTTHGFEGHGMRVAVEAHWLQFTAPAAGPAAMPGPGSLESPGLWTPLRRSGEDQCAFDVPILAVTQEDNGDMSDGLEDDTLGAYLRWVLASWRGTLPEHWRAPSRSSLESWLPTGALTVQLGPLVRQGELVATESRWALRFPVLPSLPGTLPPWREQALLDLIAHARAQWRMVRLGITQTGEETRALIGEVDLSGAPHSPSLFLTSLDALKQVVLWMVETADLLADVTVTFRALDPCRPHNPNERTEP